MHTSLRYFGALSSCAALAVSIAFIAGTATGTGKDKYAVKVPDGLAFSDFKGYESWQAVSLSQNDKAVAIILGNPALISAYQAGIPANGKPFPDGAKMAKIHWAPKQSEKAPGPTTVAGNLLNVDFMLKDAKRFADSGGWGYAAFDYDDASDSFAPSTLASHPPQGNDAKCGFACHGRVKTRDYVFTEYAPR